MVDQAEIHRKAASGEVEERRDAASLLRDNFADLPDKEQAWEDLHQLIGDEDDADVRWRAVGALGSVFQHIPDKEQAQKDLHQRIGDKYSGVRRGATYSLGTVFPYVPDKEQAQKDLHQRTRDEYEDDANVRWFAARALGSVFQHVPDKKQAWADLIWLTEDKDKYVRLGAADALGSAFQHALDKEEAWNDLHRLTGSEDVYVRLGATGALGSAFQHVPDKKQAWEYLIRLTRYEDKYVRASANHSLGRASIFKATEVEGSDDFKSELKNAIQFFEISLKETDFNPSRFCLPFYRLFYTIAFEKTGAEGEVQKRLDEAKSASDGSKNKELLLEAVENLANALSRAQKVTDFNAIRSELNACRLCFDRAADLIGDAAEGAPGAARVLQRGLPIIDDRIKEIIREIQEKAEAVCRETRGTGTPYESLGIKVNKWAGELSDRDYLQNEQTVSRIIDTLIEFCNILPEGKRERPCRIVEEIREGDKLEDKLSGIDRALLYLQPSIESQLQSATKPMTDKTRSDEQPSQKTGHSTTVFAEAGSTVVVPHTETESGDVAVNTAVTNKPLPESHRTKTAIKIIAAFAVGVLVHIFSNRYLENLTPTASTVIAFIVFIILLTIILTQNRDESS